MITSKMTRAEVEAILDDDGNFLKAGGVYEPGTVKKTKFMKAAFDLGRRI